MKCKQIVALCCAAGMLLGVSACKKPESPSKDGLSGNSMTEGSMLDTQTMNSGSTSEAMSSGTATLPDKKINSSSTSQTVSSGAAVTLPGDMTKAEVRTVSGRPRLFVNGRETEPYVFSAATQLNGENAAVSRQIGKAGKNGIDIVQVSIFSLYYLNRGELEKSVRAAVDYAVRQNADAYVFLRFTVYANASVFRQIPRNENIIDQKGNMLPWASLGSDKWYEQAKKIVSEVVDIVLSDKKLYTCVIGYHFGAGETGEFFTQGYWNGVIDHSVANTKKFREYLLGKYGTDQALQKAWNDPSAVLAAAKVPSELPGNGPGTQSSARFSTGESIIFSPSGQRYFDYLDYYNGMIADRIVGLAAVVKRMTGANSLVSVFYGYHNSTFVPASGSFSLQRVLDCPDVDIIAGPLDYANRNEGGPGASMSFFGSVMKAGKLWFDEGDYRSPLHTSEGAPIEGIGEEAHIASKENLLEVLRRQSGKMMVYGTGVWYLDLINKGWFDDDDFWAEAGRLQALSARYEKTAPYSDSDIAIVLDERAMMLSGDAFNLAMDLYVRFMETYYASGYSWNTYLIRDVEEGRVDAKLYIILNPWLLSSKQAANLENVLHKAGRTSLWMYGHGNTSAADMQRLTGMTFTVKSGTYGSAMTVKGHVLPGLADGSKLGGRTTKPQYIAGGDGVKAVAHYDNGMGVSLATMEQNGWRSVFCGGTEITSGLLDAAAAFAGVHRFSDSGDICYANRSLVTLHTKTAGKKTIRFPAACDVYDYSTNTWHTGVSKLEISAARYQTRYFFYGKKNDFIKAGF